jgi:hypothetical protein
MGGNSKNDLNGGKATVGNGERVRLEEQKFFNAIGAKGIANPASEIDRKIRKGIILKEKMILPSGFQNGIIQN